MAVTTRVDGVTIINDAFNAGPESVLAALDALGDVGCDLRRIAILGEMAELGDTSVERHRRVADAAGLARLLVVGTGKGADVLAAAYTAATGTAPARHTPDTATTAAHDPLVPGDVLLVKGAHALRLEAVAHRLLEA
ncbi:glutamate ligase domain-containing protein [Streptomyces sp. NPDC057250]